MTEALLRFVTRELLTGRSPESLEPGTELLESGLLDSLGVMQLVWFIEQEFGVTVPAEDVVIEHFQSIDTIAAYVERNRTEEPASE